MSTPCAEVSSHRQRVRSQPDSTAAPAAFDVPPLAAPVDFRRAR